MYDIYDKNYKNYIILNKFVSAFYFNLSFSTDNIYPLHYMYNGHGNFNVNLGK